MVLGSSPRVGNLISLIRNYFFLKVLWNLANTWARFTNSVYRGAEGIVNTVENITIHDAKKFILIPFILFLIINTIIIRLGFKFRFFSYCYKIKKLKESKDVESEKKECLNTVLYNVMYFIIVLLSASVCTNIVYIIVFYILNINIYIARIFYVIYCK